MNKPPSSSGFDLARHMLPSIALCIAVVLLVVLFCYLIDVLLLAFAGVLLAILLRTPATWLARHTRLSEGWALCIVIVVVFSLLGAAGWFFGHSLTQELSTLVQRWPQMLAKVRGRFAEYGWLIGEIQPADWLKSDSGTLGRGISAIAATFGALGSFVIIVFTGIFFAVNPGVYIRGLLQLVPLAQRPRAAEVVKAIGETLRRWLVGQVLLMVLIGSAAGIGLGLLGVPLAFALGLITGLLEFVPYVGPIMSAILAVLVAVGETPELALYVLALFLVIHSLEGYVLTPLVQERAVYLPPAALLLAQVVLGILVGIVGIMLATPLAATFLVITQKLYVHDVLGQPEKPHK